MIQSFRLCPLYRIYIAAIEDGLPGASMVNSRMLSEHHFSCNFLLLHFSLILTVPSVKYATRISGRSGKIANLSSSDIFLNRSCSALRLSSSWNLFRVISYSRILHRRYSFPSFSMINGVGEFLGFTPIHSCFIL